MQRGVLREQGLPQAAGVGPGAAPGWDSPMGEGGGWVLSMHPKWDGPFSFYTINVLHQHLLPARPFALGALPRTIPQPWVQMACADPTPPTIGERRVC